jgi:hypothetical protein
MCPLDGRLEDVPLPRSLDILVPGFGRDFGELQISVIDTKGVDDVAVREDLDMRLKDPRSAVVFCSYFNDAPGNTTRILLDHMRKTFSERVDTGKVSILALPRSSEARATKDDMGELVLSDAEGYEFKRMQVAGELSADDLSGVPMMFFNVESDDPKAARIELFNQLNRMRKSVEEQLLDLCAAVQEIIENHEKQALIAAVEEVANRLNSFLKGNRSLGAREQLAYFGGPQYGTRGPIRCDAVGVGSKERGLPRPQRCAPDRRRSRARRPPAQRHVVQGAGCLLEGTPGGRGSLLGDAYDRSDRQRSCGIKTCIP